MVRVRVRARVSGQWSVVRVRVRVRVRVSGQWEGLGPGLGLESVVSGKG